MKKWLPLIITALFAGWLVGKIPQRAEGQGFRRA